MSEGYERFRRLMDAYGSHGYLLVHGATGSAAPDNDADVPVRSERDEEGTVDDD